MNTSTQEGMIRRQEGMTLIELIMVIVITGLLATVTGRMLVDGADIYTRVREGKEVLHGSRLAAQRLLRDLRQVAAQDSIISASDNSFRFVDISGSEILYSCSDNRLLRNNDLLADNVTNFAFTYYDNVGNVLMTPLASLLDIWRIQFTVTTTMNGLESSTTSSVIPRNF